MSAVLLVAGAVLAAPAGAGAQELFSFDDVRGDDDGNGSLIYPNRDDMHEGDLDLVRLSAEQRGDGIWFLAEMSQPIVSPVGRVTKIGQSPVERLARNGFYTFNIDIYVDTDRVGGSGQTGAVPGRRVTVDRQFAWEKCIVLTPRPDTARTMLQMYVDNVFEADLRARQGKVSRDELQDLQGRSEKRVNDLFFFPTKVRVAGRRIEFFVPAAFLGGVASKSWAYTVMVTGADIEQVGQPGQGNAAKSAMMTMGVRRGVNSDTWGIRSDADEATPPVIDILAGDPKTQAGVLSNYDMVSGRLAAVPGVAPDGKVAVAASGEEPSPQDLTRIDLGSAPATSAAPKASTEPLATSPAPKAPTEPLATSAAPKAPTEPLATSAAPKAPTEPLAIDAPQAPAERQTLPARLRTLNQLLAEGLITQAEYNEMRRKILQEL